MQACKLEGGISIRRFEAHDADDMFALIEQNRARLDRWLRWSPSIRTHADVSAHIARFDAGTRRDVTGFHCGIWTPEGLAGGVICWYINRENRNAEVGYWLGEGFTGRGLATEATCAAVSYLFRAERLHRVEMQCGVENVRSRAIPERLGFTLEGVRRASHWITSQYVDHAIYGMLENEWKHDP